MTNVEIAKLAARIVVMLGSGKIVNGIIANNVATTTIPSQVLIRSTAFIIGGMTSDATGRYTDRKIDELKDILDGKKSVKLI